MNCKECEVEDAELCDTSDYDTRIEKSYFCNSCKRKFVVSFEEVDYEILWGNWKMKYKFNISTDADIVVESDNIEDARMKVINNMERGEYDQELAPNPSSYVDDGVLFDEWKITRK